MREKRGIEAKERDALTGLLLEGYRSDPESVSKALPFVSQRLKALLAPKPNTQPHRRLTERERDHHRGRLHALLKGSRPLSRDQAIEALEHAATLLEDRLAQDAIDRDRLLQLAKGLAKVSLSQTAKPSTVSVRDGEPSRSVPLVRGVTLSLTWDGKLVSIAFDPKEFQRGRQALAFVGIGAETRADVAERHDHYLAELGPSD